MKTLLALTLVIALCTPAICQVVQLPSVSTFGTSGTVVVPDQGTASLGGMGSSRSGSISRGFGPLATQARGAGTNVTSVSVSATIIDLQAMDEALLNRPPEQLPPASYPPRKHGKPLVNTLAPKHYDRLANRPPRQATVANDWAIALGTPGDQTIDINTTENNVRYFMDMAAHASATGRVAAAKVYYNMALERMTPDQRERLIKLKERNAEAAKRGIAPDKLDEELKKEAAEKAAQAAKTSPNTTPAR